METGRCHETPEEKTFDRRSRSGIKRRIVPPSCYTFDVLLARNAERILRVNNKKHFSISPISAACPFFIYLAEVKSVSSVCCARVRELLPIHTRSPVSLSLSKCSALRRESVQRLMVCHLRPGVAPARTHRRRRKTRDLYTLFVRHA